MTEMLFTGLFLFALGRCFGWCIKKKNPFMLLLGAMFFALPIFTAYDQGAIIPVIFGVIGVLSSFGFTVTGLVVGFFNLFKFKPKTRAKNHNKNENTDNGRNYYEEARREREQQKNQHQQERESWKKEQQRQQQKEQANQQNQSNRPGGDNSRKSSNTADSRSAMDILGLKQGYTKKDLKDAYKRQCARFHPDKNVGKPPSLRVAMEEEMKKINEAYNKLS